MLPGKEDERRPGLEELGAGGLRIVPGERGAVVQDVNRAPVGPEDEIPLARMDLDVVHRDVGESSAHAHPGASSVEGDEPADLGARHQQVLALGMLDDVVDPAPGQSGPDRGETRAPVLGHEDVSGEVPQMMAVHRHVEAVFVVGRGSDAADRRPERLERQVGLKELPGLAVVGGARDAAVVGADVDEAGNQRRLGERREGAPIAHPVVHGQHPFGGEHSQDGKLAAVLAQRQVLGGAPGAPEVVRQEEAVPPDVHPPRSVGRGPHRREPVEPVAVLVLVGEGADGGPVAGGGVNPHRIAVLGGGQRDARLAGNRLLVHPVAAVRLPPVAVQDARLVAGGRGPHPGVGVLRSPVDVVRHLQVQRDRVELGERDVVDLPPGDGPVPRLVDPPVVAEQQVLRRLRINPERVVVAVDADVVGRGHVPVRPERAPAVVGEMELRAEHIDPADVGGVHLDVGVIHGTRVQVRNPFPARPAVMGAVEPRLAGVLDEREDAQRIGAGDLEADAADGAARQPLLEALPGVAAVRGSEDSAVGSAPVEAPRRPAAGVGAGIEDGRIPEIHLEIHDPGVGGDVEHVLPGCPGVVGPEDAALATRAPKRSDRRHEGAARLVGVHDDPPDVLAVREAGVPEGVPAVEGNIDAVAERGTLPVRRFAGPHPDGRRVRRGERDRADRGGREVVEDGVPGGAVVPGPEEPAGSGRRVELPGPAGRDGEIRDAPGHHRGSDGTKGQIVHDGSGFPGVLGGSRHCHGQRESQYKKSAVIHGVLRTDGAG